MNKNQESLINQFPEGQYQSFVPIDALLPFVEAFWVHELNEYCSHNKTELELPSLNHEIIFKFGQDFEEYCPINKTYKIQANSIITGVRTFAKSSKRTDFNKSLFLVGIRFKPLGMYTLFDIPLQEFYNQSISFSEFIIPILLELEQELIHKKNSSEVIHFLNQRLNSYYTNSNVSLDALRFYQELDKSKLQDYSTFIKNSEFHYKYLERKFKKYIGITPKKFFKTQRFLSFYKSWFLNNQYEYIDSVYQFHYFDQSHLIKDFKSVLGDSPSTFLKTMNQSYTQNIRLAYPR